MTSLNPNLLHSANQLKHWIVDHALPHWHTHGFDEVNGCFYEKINRDGLAAKAANKRVRVQARQQFVYAHAHDHHWYSNSETLCNQISQYLTRFCRHPKSAEVYVHLVDHNNQVVDDKLDIYDIAFHILAASAQYKAFKQPIYLEQAEQIVKLIDSQFKGHGGGWNEGNYLCFIRRQNPHMHLFEAFMSMFEACGEAKWLARAAEIFALFESTFFDSYNEVLLEYFERDWQVYHGKEGKIIEPGHMMEWVWLLRKYEKLAGTPVDKYANVLFENALKYGLNETTGLLYDEVTVDGTHRAKSHRNWAITEYIKASIAQSQAGYKEAEAITADAINLLFKYYITDCKNNMYYDKVDLQGNPLDDTAPASTLYHLILAATEVDNYCQSAIKQTA